MTIDPFTGAFSFVPLNGPASFAVSVRVTDNGSPPLSDVKSFVITVLNVAPVANAGPDQTVTAGVAVSLHGAFSDPGAADPHTFCWEVTSSTGQAVPSGNALDFTFTPASAGTYVIAFTVTDTDGGSGSDTVTLTAAAPPTNQPPVLGALGDRTVNEGGLVAFTVTASDPDVPAQRMTFSLEPGAPLGASIDPVSGAFSFLPQDGPELYHVAIRVTDNGSPPQSDLKSFAVAVLNVPPVADAGPDQTVTAGSTVTLHGTFTDPCASDSHACRWTVTSDTGQAVPPGDALDFAFTPDVSGMFVVTLTVTDKDGGSGSDTAIVTVLPPNRSPEARKDRFTTSKNTALTAPPPGVLENDSDPDGSPLTAVLVNAPGHGNVVLNPDGSFQYTPSPDFTGKDEFLYKANDGSADSKPVTVTIHVTKR
jgi:imidazole glycerol phosphate synthase subunit HisF